MKTIECPVCLRDVTLDENAREGDILQCPICKIWFKLVLVNGQLEAERVNV
jgi:uncharacterized protein YbaR (Trm112 family)